jgi:methionyl-tRNA synthetase
LDDVLYSTADSLRAVAVLLASFMPKSCHLLWESLGVPGDLADARISAVATDHLPAGVTVRKGPILFPRLDG